MLSKDNTTIFFPHYLKPRESLRGLLEQLVNSTLLCLALIWTI